VMLYRTCVRRDELVGRVERERKSHGVAGPRSVNVCFRLISHILASSNRSCCRQIKFGSFKKSSIDPGSSSVRNDTDIELQKDIVNKEKYDSEA